MDWSAIINDGVFSNNVGVLKLKLNIGNKSVLNAPHVAIH